MDNKIVSYTPPSDSQIEACEKAGFNRWTKDDYDRLYIDLDKLGLCVSRYNTGNIWQAHITEFYLDDDEKICEAKTERIPNARASEILCCRFYIDIKTGDVYVKKGYYMRSSTNSYIEPLYKNFRILCNTLLDPKTDDDTEE